MKDDLFENTDNMTIDSLAQDFPVLTDEEKERIYAMSERKYNNDTDMNTDEKFDRKIEVTGVERYKRPGNPYKWRHTFCKQKSYQKYQAVLYGLQQEQVELKCLLPKT